MFLPGESHGQRSLTGYSPWGFKGSGHDSCIHKAQTVLFRLNYPLIGELSLVVPTYSPKSLHILEVCAFPKRLRMLLEVLSKCLQLQENNPLIHFFLKQYLKHIYLMHDERDIIKTQLQCLCKVIFLGLELHGELNFA